ncbi:hypothetical protein GQ42DRAFT_161638 [Ramicandelaber brevisporus]|nr:hypothetical protein GQ42DRAFT_161638 [Ramicandelaber brevisporus]
MATCYRGRCAGVLPKISAGLLPLQFLASVSVFVLYLYSFVTAVTQRNLQSITEERSGSQSVPSLILYISATLLVALPSAILSIFLAIRFVKALRYLRHSSSVTTPPLPSTSPERQNSYLATHLQSPPAVARGACASHSKYRIAGSVFIALLAKLAAVLTFVILHNIDCSNERALHKRQFPWPPGNGPWAAEVKPNPALLSSAFGDASHILAECRVLIGGAVSALVLAVLQLLWSVLQVIQLQRATAIRVGASSSVANETVIVTTASESEKY